jgi:SAM-dependent methyltransferase
MTAALWPQCWDDYADTVLRLTSLEDVGRVCEVGGGAKPATLPDGIEHVVLDISPIELAKVATQHETIEADVASSSFRWSREPVDLVLSSFLAEHIADAAAFHRNVLSILRPGGYALHLFPAKGALPFLLNRALPERISGPLLLRLQGFRSAHGTQGKFPAYYRWCVGPSRAQRHRLESSGFEIVEYRAYYGHGYYLHVPLLHRVEQRKAGILTRWDIPILASYCLVLLRKPSE